MSENVSEKDHLKTVVRIVLWLAIAIVALLIVKVLLLPLLTTPRNSVPLEPTLTPSPISNKLQAKTSTRTPTNTYTPSFTATENSLLATYTPSPFPEPKLEPTIINGPPLFRVEGWNSNDAICKTEVIIYGVTVSHGNAPYVFTFWSQEEPYTPRIPVINQVIPLENSRDYVEFKPPIVLVRDKYKHVEFTFQREDGIPVTWIKDLLYLPCS